MFGTNKNKTKTQGEVGGKAVTRFIETKRMVF